jgi:hypothetical protein
LEPSRQARPVTPRKRQFFDHGNPRQYVDGERFNALGARPLGTTLIMSCGSACALRRLWLPALGPARRPALFEAAAALGDPRRPHLESHNAPPIYGVWVDWASDVLAIIRRAKWRKPSNEGRKRAARRAVSGVSFNPSGVVMKNTVADG